MFIAPPGSASSQLLPSRFGELRSEDFVKLIFTELRNQDPFKPNDTSELLRQIDSIRSIQTNMDLGQRLSQVANTSHLGTLTDLIGRFVKGLSTEYIPVSGTVISVHPTSQGALLELASGHFIPSNLIQSIGSGPTTNSAG